MGIEVLFDLQLTQLCEHVSRATNGLWIGLVLGQIAQLLFLLGDQIRRSVLPRALDNWRTNWATGEVEKTESPA